MPLEALWAVNGFLHRCCSRGILRCCDSFTDGETGGWEKLCHSCRSRSEAAVRACAWAHGPALGLCWLAQASRSWKGWC